MEKLATAVQFGPQALQCAVDMPRALRYLGQRRQELPEHLEQRCTATAVRCAQTARPRGVARVYALSQGEEGQPLQLTGTEVVLPGVDIARFLQGCTHVALLAVTLGMENQRELARAQALGPLEELLMDACSSSLAEEAARSASRLVGERAQAAGFTASRRFSPGYGDLPLRLQPDILRLSGGDKLLGIHVGPSLLMTPMKSITAVVGLAPICPDSGNKERR